MLYYLGPWLWSETPDGDGGVERRWQAPAGVVGSLDLRPTAAQAQAGGAPALNVGFFASTTPLASEYDLLAEGDLREIAVDAPMLDAWEALVGYRPSGDRLIDLLWDQLTAGAVVDGSAPAPPLVPTVAGELELWLGGHSLVKRERFRWGAHPHTAKLRELLQREFRGLWEATNGGPVARKWLDDQRGKYGLRGPADWREFVPPDLVSHVPGPLPRETTISDNFDRADESLDASGSWAEVKLNWRVIANVANLLDSNNGSARYQTDLSSADHFCQVDVTSLTGVTTRYAGPAVRFASAADTQYMSRLFASTGNVHDFAKCVAGTITALGTSNNETISLPDTLKLQVNGSSLERFFNGTSRETITDTSITGGTRCGMVANSGGGDGSRLDNWSAEDLAAPTGHPAIRRLGGARPAISMSSTTLKAF